MKKEFLFPNRYKILGWILFVPSFLCGAYLQVFPLENEANFTFKVFAIVCNGFLEDYYYFSVIENCIIDEILLTLIIVGGILVAFSKTKIEDEFISKLRYESLVWATYFNFTVMLVATLFVYDIVYLNFLIANIFSMLFFFIIRFHFLLIKLQKTTNNEE